MKNIVYILFFLSSTAFGQTIKWTKKEIETYTKTIDGFCSENRLVRVSYPNMSGCGGALDGYYLNKNLVLMEAVYQGELGFSSQKIYVQRDKFLKLIYREHFAEWGKYYEKYPAEKYELDSTKMTYTDTVYKVWLANQIVFIKSSSQKAISNEPNQKVIDRIVSCGHSMTHELQEVTKQVDSLKFVKEMPYSCEDGICGDNLFWDVVKLGDNGIELLIDRLDDPTPTTANVVLFGVNHTVADIAFTALTEIIHDIPTFELLGVPFDQEGCGYCTYWRHLNKSDSNRQKFKDAVRVWYHKNKANLIWVENNQFTSCDCNGKHPNGGHYKLNTGRK